MREFKHWSGEQRGKTHLDMTRFCWPEAQLTGEAKFSDLGQAILQELVFMRQQRRTQPLMKTTTEVMGVLRACTLGVEQCTFTRNYSRGVLDGIRICLRVVRSTALQRGQHEAFELHYIKILGYPHHFPSTHIL